MPFSSDNTETMFGQVDPAVASDASGSFLVTWESFGDGSGESVFARRFLGDATPAGPQFLVNVVSFVSGDLDPDADVLLPASPFILYAVDRPARVLAVKTPAARVRIFY